MAVLSLFSIKQPTAQSTPSDQSSSSHISLLPSFSFPSLNNGQSHINTRGSFHRGIPRGGLITLGCFVCLLDGQRSWIEQQAGEDSKKEPGQIFWGVKWGFGLGGGRSPGGSEEDRSAVEGQKATRDSFYRGSCLSAQWTCRPRRMHGFV